MTQAPPSQPSGEPMPVGDIPGWRQVFADDFDEAVPRGAFPAAVADRWGAYPTSYRDTSKHGTYDPGIVSFHDGVMDLHVHTSPDGVRHVAAPIPRIPTAEATKWGDFTYGRIGVRFRSDALPGYKTAWLLWPSSGDNLLDGEIDFPEGDLDGVIRAFLHHAGGRSNADQDAFETAASYREWHTAVTEWEPGRVAFILDGETVGVSTERVPSNPMHYVIQTETNLDGYVPDAAVAGHLQLDWVVVYRPA